MEFQSPHSPPSYDGKYFFLDNTDAVDQTFINLTFLKKGAKKCKRVNSNKWGDKTNILRIFASHTWEL